MYYEHWVLLVCNALRSAFCIGAIVSISSPPTITIIIINPGYYSHRYKKIYSKLRDFVHHKEASNSRTVLINNTMKKKIQTEIYLLNRKLRWNWATEMSKIKSSINESCEYNKNNSKAFYNSFYFVAVSMDNSTIVGAKLNSF